jgi:3-hydroxyisobutyrate dehydrogenase-like beta-hydroxyacid dehydrogenase
MTLHNREQELASGKAAMIGLGLIGSAWAKNLFDDGLLAASWNRSPKPQALLPVQALAELPSKAQILHIVVADEHALGSVLEQLVPQLSSAHLVIQSSTIDPQTSRQLKAKVESRSARYLEAPFTGSLPAAQERKTIFYLGGEAELVERARPYLARLSRSQFHIGSCEQACCLKLVMNLQIASAVEALAEALTIARNAGIPDVTFYEAFRENAAFSGVAALKQAKLCGNDFSPQFSLQHMSKDMRLLAKSAAPERYPALRMLREVLTRGEQAGLGEQDFSVVVKLLQGGVGVGE